MFNWICFFPFGCLNSGREGPFLQAWQALVFLRSRTTFGIACLTHAVVWTWMANCQSHQVPRTYNPKKSWLSNWSCSRKHRICVWRVYVWGTDTGDSWQPLCMGSFLRKELWWCGFIQTLGPWSEIASISILWAKSWPAAMLSGYPILSNCNE